MTKLFVLVLTCAASMLPIAEARAACAGAPGRSGAFTLDVGATPRTFVVRAPSSADGKTPLPVVVALHPFGMNGQYMQSRVSSRLWPDAIFVYPDGQRSGGGPSWAARADGADADLVFFDAMLAWLRREQCVDETRVFVLGYSNGAGFANVLACLRASAVAGIALAAGRPVCAPQSPMPVIVGHGLRDTTAGYESAVRAVQAWSAANGCKAPPTIGVAGCFAADGCAAAPTRLCTHTGGHEYSATFSRAALEFFQKVP